MGEGWDPLRESLCEYVARQRIEQQMTDSYDDKLEARLEQRKALCLWWARPRLAPPAPVRVQISQLTLWPATVHDTDDDP